MKLRFIGMSNETTGEDQIILTEDLKSKASYWLAIGFTVYEDVIFDGSMLPMMFPKESVYVRQL